jgi:hypothetical protein
MPTGNILVLAVASVVAYVLLMFVCNQLVTLKLEYSRAEEEYDHNSELRLNCQRAEFVRDLGHGAFICEEAHHNATVGFIWRALAITYAQTTASSPLSFTVNPLNMAIWLFVAVCCVWAARTLGELVLMRSPPALIAPSISHEPERIFFSRIPQSHHHQTPPRVAMPTHQGQGGYEDDGSGDPLEGDYLDNSATSSAGIWRRTPHEFS